MIYQDVIIIGGGQSGLATAYFLKRQKIDFLILDSSEVPGGAWIHAWKSLNLFSPKEFSSLPGWIMPPCREQYPHREEIIEYLKEYEKRYGLPVKRPVKVEDVSFKGGLFRLKTTAGEYRAKVVVGATGNWTGPYIPDYMGRGNFKGIQVHSAFYESPEKFSNKKVLIVGGGNSAAQILAEVCKVAQTIWVTKEPPEFLPDDVDGRYLFDLASREYKAKLRGEDLEEAHNLSKIVMVKSVKEARSRNALVARSPFKEIKEHSILWENGHEETIDAIIWCTGFRPNFSFLKSLNVINKEGIIDTDGSRALACPGLWLIGYGDWTGFASATLVGVSRSARMASFEIKKFLVTENQTRPNELNP